MVLVCNQAHALSSRACPGHNGAVHASFLWAMSAFAFRHRWTAEALHRLGVPARWRRGSSAPEDLSDPDESAVLRWSLLQPECQLLAARVAAWNQGAFWLCFGAMLAALLAGAGSAWSVLGDGSRPVNVLWAVMVLLGMPSASLLLVFAVSVRGGGRGWSFGGWVLQIERWRARGKESAAVVEAWTRLAASGGALRPALQSVSHAVWVAALAGAMIGLLAAFSLRSYQFVWETTVLPDRVFVVLVQLLGAPGQVFGFAQPDAEAIAASIGEGLSAPDVRRAWAAWLIGVLCTLGIAPRLLLGSASTWKAWRAFRGARLDLQQPFFQQLLGQRASALMRLGASGGSTAVPLHRLARYAGQGEGSRLVALELPPGDVDDESWRDIPLHAVDDREAREAELDWLAAHPVQRLLVLLDARHSPDRSVSVWMAEASRHAAQTAVCLLGWGTAEPERQDAWREHLTAFGLGADAIRVDSRAAKVWLQAGSA